MFQVYFLSKQNTPSEWGFYSGAWHGENHPGHTTTSPNSGIAVIPVKDSNDLRVGLSIIVRRKFIYSVN